MVVRWWTWRGEIGFSADIFVSSQRVLDCIISDMSAHLRRRSRIMVGERLEGWVRAYLFALRRQPQARNRFTKNTTDVMFRVRQL